MPFPNGYVLGEAQETMTLAAIAYEGEDDAGYEAIKAAIEAKLAASSLLDGRYHLVWLGVGPDLANLCYVARDDREPARYAVVARGTDWNFLEDWLDDFDVLDTHDWPTANPPDEAIEVAQGSWDGLEGLLAMTSQVFTAGSSQAVTLVQLLEQLASGSAGGIDLFVTGHSLGGALATILGLYLVDTVQAWGGSTPVALKTYTFAAPTTGNAAYAAYYDARAGLADVSWQAFRVFNEQDLVPFAYEDLSGFADSGIPLSLKVHLEVDMIALIVDRVLDYEGVEYVQPSSIEPLPNDPPLASAPPQCSSSGDASCPDPASTMKDFACWVCYEHSALTYLALLGADQTGLHDRSLDVAGIAATTSQDLKAKAAAAVEA